jgi:arylsulfatase A-like enzyme
MKGGASAGGAGPRGFTRRGLLKTGGAGAGAALAAQALPFTPAAAAQGTPDVPNALVIVVSNMRWDHVGHYGSERALDTPNLDELAGDSMWFKNAMPESMPGIPSQRALITGMRSFPFRDWKPTDGYAAYPGWGPVHSIHPLVTEVMRAGGINANYVTDNPFLSGGRFEDFRRPDGAQEPGEPATRSERPSAAEIERDMIGELDRDQAAAERAIDTGIGLLGDLARNGPFYLGVDGLDPQDAVEVPAAYVDGSDPDPIRQGGDPYAPIFPVDLQDSTIDRVRERYEDYVRGIDDLVGRLMQAVDDEGLLDNTLVWFLSHNGIALGEHGMMGRAAPTSYREAHFVPYLIRDPDGRRKGDKSFYFASTHDVAPTLLSMMDLVIPGKMDGEDLTALLADEDPPQRHFFTSGMPTGMLAGNNRFLLVVAGDNDQRALYDVEGEDDGENSDEPWDEEDHDTIRDHPSANERLLNALFAEAGGTLPDFNEDGAIRPVPEQEDDDELDADEEDLPSDEDETPGNDPNRRDT